MVLDRIGASQRSQLHGRTLDLLAAFRLGFGLTPPSQNALISPRYTFLEWVVDIQTQNSLLVRHEAHLSEPGLRYHLEANMNKNLAIEYRTSDAKNEATLRIWVEKVKEFDEKRIRDARQLRDQTNVSMRNNSKGCFTDNRGKTDDPSCHWPPHQPKSTPRLPVLTDEEHKLLCEKQKWKPS